MIRYLLYILLLITATGFAAAEPKITISGVEYLETGEEFFHRMDTSQLKEGDTVTLTDKRGGPATKKAKVKSKNEKSVVLIILAD